MKRLLPLLVLMNLAWANQEIKMSVTALNSPVSEAAILLKLEPSKAMIFKDVNVRIKNKSKPPFRERIKDYPVEKQGEGYLLKLPTRDYPVDQYEILVIAKTDTRRVWEVWKSVPPVAKGHADFEVKTNQIIVDGDQQPPHPGEAGKETLLGIDSDKDGVRDDIEIWINEYDQRKEVRELLKKMAKNETQLMIHQDNKQEAIRYDEKNQYAVLCLIYLVNDTRSLKIVREFNAVFRDTPERIKAGLKSESQLHGVDFSKTTNDIIVKGNNHLACEKVE